MNAVIELHDSVIAAIVEVGSQAIVVLRAYVHRSEGRAGRDPGSGWIQAVALCFSEAEIEGAWPDLPADIFDGTLVTGGEMWENTFPLPLGAAGETTLRVHTTLGKDWTVRGSRVVLTRLGEAAYVEEFPGVTNGAARHARHPTRDPRADENQSTWKRKRSPCFSSCWS